jgi:hypothetical protein
MRRTERFKVELPIVWNRAGRAIACVAADVNQHGMFICTDELVEEGSLMHVQVRLSDRTLEMFVTARFVGRTMNGHGIGCEIFLIDDVSQSHWLAFYEGLCGQAAAARKATALSA